MKVHKDKEEEQALKMSNLGRGNNNGGNTRWRGRGGSRGHGR
ncbi:hypothetical protein A2U01_0071762, partial [Trifolium medium]|nr:hypothetical protein [Trifolium medium]